jgi:tRNA(fMet)-specific endonuclease VapC
MSLPQVILDTDILSALMRKNPNVIAKSKTYLAQHGQFTISIITRYEILRGLKVKGAAQQVTRFEEFCVRACFEINLKLLVSGV